MSNCNQDFTAKIEYEAGTKSELVQGDSISVSEAINLQTAESLGVKGNSTVFNHGKPQGQIQMTSHLTGPDLGTINDLNGNNDQEVSVQFGPYKTQGPTSLSSMSVNISIGEPISINRSFNYYDSIKKNATPLPATQNPQKPAVVENIAFNGGFGTVTGVTSATWEFSQSYESHNIINQVDPISVYQGGQLTLTVNGSGLPNELTKPGGNCVQKAEPFSIDVKDCSGNSLGSLSINGYMEGRGTNVQSQSPEESSLTIIQHL